VWIDGVLLTWGFRWVTDRNTHSLHSLHTGGSAAVHNRVHNTVHNGGFIPRGVLSNLATARREGSGRLRALELMFDNDGDAGSEGVR
jgi:hypothetical protein